MTPLEDQNGNQIWESVPDTLTIQIRHPREIPDSDDSLAYHAVRLLLLIYFAGDPQKKLIEGRTKLAKMDFLVRYPTYLAEAARIKGVKTNLVLSVQPESRMIRYKYGPWDAKYYDIFALLVAKDLIKIFHHNKKGDVFQITPKGEAAVSELVGPEFEEIIERCRLVYVLFGKSAGSTIKNFIYHYFTAVVDKPLGAEIEGADAK
ncbi:MAG: hypothetical protein PHQ40_07735 [Anaerolineaceae bacterium]|nr:hypothetical protein [Anaerolineaceae bacterium]